MLAAKESISYEMNASVDKRFIGLCKNHFHSYQQVFLRIGDYKFLYTITASCVHSVQNPWLQDRESAYNNATAESLMPELSQKCPQSTYFEVPLTKCGLHVLGQSTTKFPTWPSKRNKIQHNS